MPEAFVSYFSGDRPFVERYATALKHELGEDHVFYDAWSLKPGDNLVGGIDDALAKATHFFLFMTAESLTRPWVKAEWAGAFIRQAAGQTELIPVRLDDCQAPPLLASLQAIDAADIGPGQAEIDILKAVRGESTYRPAIEPPNLTACIEQEDSELLRVRFQVARYVDHVPSYALGFDAPAGSVLNARVLDVMMCQVGPLEWAPDGVNPTHAGVLLTPPQPTTPLKPCRVEVANPPGPLAVCANRDGDIIPLVRPGY